MIVCLTGRDFILRHDSNRFWRQMLKIKLKPVAYKWYTEEITQLTVEQLSIQLSWYVWYIMLIYFQHQYIFVDSSIHNTVILYKYCLNICGPEHVLVRVIGWLAFFTYWPAYFKYQGKTRQHAKAITLPSEMFPSETVKYFEISYTVTLSTPTSLISFTAHHWSS